jgi:probable HAF family extracellular repeat protein
LASPNVLGTHFKADDHPVRDRTIAGVQAPRRPNLVVNPYFSLLARIQGRNFFGIQRGRETKSPFLRSVRTKFLSVSVSSMHSDVFWPPKGPAATARRRAANGFKGFHPSTRRSGFRPRSLFIALFAAELSLHGASLTPLGDVPGGIFATYAENISADGTTVVGWSPADVNRRRVQAFRWTEQQGIVGLGDLTGGLYYSRGMAVSADGSIVVGDGASSAGGEATRWTAESGLVSMGDLDGGPTGATAFDVSDDGGTMVGRGNSSLSDEAFRWTEGEGMVGLGVFPGGIWSSANGISGDGQVIVGSAESEGGQQAFRWTAEAGIQGLGDFPGGAFYSVANDASQDGTVIVGSSVSERGTESFRWTAETGMVSLGDLPGGRYASVALAVSADGFSVVGSGTTAQGMEAFIWTQDRGLQRLWDRLAAQGVDPAANGWTALVSASGISADGHRIAGYGKRSGNTEAFLAHLDAIDQEPPLLTIANRADGSIQLTWNASPGFVLGTSEAPVGPVWTPVPSDATGSAIISPGGGAQFFRTSRAVSN